MADLKVSQFPNEVITPANTDLFYISDDLGGGSFESKRITWANIIANLPSHPVITDDRIPRGDGTTVEDGTWRNVGNDLLPVNAGSDIGSFSARLGNIWLGSTTINFSSDLVFDAGGERVRFGIDGNVGIGVDAATDGRLVVRSGTNGTEKALLVENLSGTDRFFVQGDGVVNIGNLSFDGTQTVGAAQDNFVLTYDNATGRISLESAAGGGSDGNGIYDGSGTLSAITTITNAGFDLNLLGTGNFNVGASGIAAKLGVQGDAGQDIVRFRDSSNVSRFYQDSQGKVTIQGQNGGVKNFRVLNNAGDETFVVGSTGDAARVHLTSAGDTSRFAVNRSDPRCAGDFSSKGHPNDMWASMNFDQIPIVAQSNNTPINSWMGIQYRNDTETTIASLDVQIKAGNQSDFWMVPSSSGTFNIGRPDAPNPIFKCDRSTQSVGVNTTTIDASAVVDIVSTTGGFLPPRMTTAERDAITSPATGLVIYNTTTNVLNFYNGTAWGAV